MEKERRPGLRQLAILEWLVEAPIGHRYLSTSEGRFPYFHEVVHSEGSKPVFRRILPSSTTDSTEEEALAARLGGTRRIDLSFLVRLGLVERWHALGFDDALRQEHGRKRYEQFMAGFARNAFHYSDMISRPNEKAFAFFEAHGRLRLSDLRAAEAERRRSVERTVLLGTMHRPSANPPAELKHLLPEGFALPMGLPKIMRPWGTAKVTRETPQRLYVADVRRFEAASPYGGPVQGYEPDLFVSTESVVLDRATPEAVARIVAIHEGFAEDHARHVREAYEQIAPIHAAMIDRMEQRLAQLEDETREALSPTPRTPRP